MVKRKKKKQAREKGKGIKSEETGKQTFIERDGKFFGGTKEDLRKEENRVGAENRRLEEIERIKEKKEILPEKKLGDPLLPEKTIIPSPPETPTEGIEQGADVSQTGESRDPGIGLEKRDPNFISKTIKGYRDNPSTLIDDLMLATGVQAISALGSVGLVGLKLIKPTVIIATAWAVDNFILSPSELTEWTAVDNIAGVTSFQVNSISFGVRDGSISPQDATISFDRAQDNIDLARATVDEISRRNPKLWAGRKIKLQAIEISQNGLDTTRAQLGL